MLLLASALAGPVSRAASTYPPQPEGRLPPRECLEASRLALYSGRPDQAYRLLLLAQPDLGGEARWLDLASRVFLALDRPGRVAETYVHMAPGNPPALAAAKAILDRTGEGPSRPALTDQGRWRGLDKKSMKPFVAVAPGAGGAAEVLTEDGVERLDSEGQVSGFRALKGGRDLTLDFSGKPLALGEDTIIWGASVIKLPPEIAKPVSAAPAPDGSFFVLDRAEPRLFRLTGKGAPMGNVAVALNEPVRVRVDRAGQIYLADEDGGQIRVYGADMAIVRTLHLSFEGKPLRKIKDFQVDMAGNLLVVDLSTRRALLYSSSGHFLTATGTGARVDAAGWDGLSTLLLLDHRAGALWRYGS